MLLDRNCRFPKLLAGCCKHSASHKLLAATMVHNLDALTSASQEGCTRAPSSLKCAPAYFFGLLHKMTRVWTLAYFWRILPKPSHDRADGGLCGVFEPLERNVESWKTGAKGCRQPTALRAVFDTYIHIINIFNGKFDRKQSQKLSSSANFMSWVANDKMHWSWAEA